MAYFHCLIGGGSSGGGYELTVTCDADFAGTTITATDGVTTLTQTCPSASPYEVVFAIPNGGEWTISGIISGQTYSESIDIPDSLELHSVPEGSTVLPTDVIQTWLACAGITDKSYTTLNEVLADSTTLLALMSNDNAVDYLVRSTTWASGITADSTAMTDIGADDYCAETLLADSTWLAAICSSTYFESVLDIKVPTMTGYTTPSGEVIYSDRPSGSYEGWKAFDGNTTTLWRKSTLSPSYVGYDFQKDVDIFKIQLNHIEGSSIKFQGYGASDWEDINDSITADNGIKTYNISALNSYQKYRLLNATTLYEGQFYGRNASS